MAPDAPQPYGAPLALEAAKKVAAPALAEAATNNWAMAVAVVDGAGDLVYFERMDATQAGSVIIAIDKARSAARFKRPTKAFQDMLATGGDGWRVLGSTARYLWKAASQSSSTARSLARSASQAAEPARWPVRPGRCRRGWAGLNFLPAQCQSHVTCTRGVAPPPGVRPRRRAN